MQAPQQKRDLRAIDKNLQVPHNQPATSFFRLQTSA
jgi:hypothetical protein